MSFAEHDDDPIIAPGLSALLRRHPHRVRAAGSATIASGVVLFVLASVMLPATAHPGRHTAVTAATAVAAPSVTAPFDLPALPIPVAAPAADRVIENKPRHVAKKAPATKAIISGLAANGIPNVALNAYRVAAARLAHAEPGCGIDWALLAGIGREESDHGRFAGATLNADGTSTPRIIGIPLNGSGTALIGDTDGGRIDGDTVYDRAAGPMQFIPSTWAAYGTDATGDGVADIFNINDAALSSARYLCAAGGDLRTNAGQVAAVLAYNHSDEYLAQVLALANAYRTGVAVYGLPVGNVTGGLPPVSNPADVPPVNPGPPTAAGPRTAAKTPASTSTASTAPTATGTQSSTSAPAPAGGSTSTSGSGGTSTGTTSGGTTTTPAPSPTPTPAPSPTPTKTCLLWDPLDPQKCDLWG